jgi:glycerol-3-phosphate dehydrogenase
MTDASVAVVGGGVTGVAVARDLATRGVDVTLLERDRLAAGATGAMHALLHSGARYAVSDPESARACAAENEVLREVAPACIEDAGGLFARLPGDDPDYLDRKAAACRETGVPVERLDGPAAREAEPSLAADAVAALRVPDAVVNPFALAATTALAAERAGATVRTGTPVVDVERDDDRVTGAVVDGADGRETVAADHVVNATGAWAGEFAALSGVDVPMAPSRGAMTVVDADVSTVVNRCRPRDSGDIVVPGPGTAVLGTTDEPVDDPDDFPREDWEPAFLREELASVVPVVGDAPVVRTYWGVRPLYEPAGWGGSGDTTDVSRGHALLAHDERDGVAGLTTLTGGKLTTHRLMAADAADHVCDRLAVGARCHTDERPLPGTDDPAALDEALARYDLAGAFEALVGPAEA